MLIRKVMLVDDDEDVHELAGFGLTEVGQCTVTHASCAAEALSQAERETPDLVLLDVGMPGVDGHQTLRQLRARPHLRNVPVIFMTSYSDQASRALHTALGAAGTIDKPFDPTRLPALIQQIVGAGQP